MNNVLVIGSINMDLVVEAEKMPGAGETLLGKSFATYPGGKGANQAVAASRLGANVSMIGCVSNDAFGRQLLAGLQQEGVDTHHVFVAEHTATGVAVITVCDAENAIVVVPGANHSLTPEHIHAAEIAFSAADVVLVQLEIPLPAVLAAAQLAARYNKPFILNPAPAIALPAELLRLTTILTPNEHELATIFSCSPEAWQDTLSAQAGRVVMTKGSDGVWFADSSGTLQHQAGFKVAAVDTTGAGDTFNGTLAAFWGMDIKTSIRMAAAAGALSVTRSGAQSGMPNHDELTAFLNNYASA